MNLSENIRYIAEEAEKWKFYKNRSYPVRIQKASPERTYNTDKPGIVYNFLEDASEQAAAGCYVVTGVVGEMWCIGESALKKYNISPDKIGYEPQQVQTIETDTVYAAIMIPSDIQFTVEADYGVKVILKGNRPDIEHGSGDFVLVPAIMENGVYKPDFSDSGRVINGMIFSTLYKPV